MHESNQHSSRLARVAATVAIVTWIAGVICLAVVWLPFDGKTWGAYETASTALLPLAASCTVAAIVWAFTRKKGGSADETDDDQNAPALEDDVESEP